MRTRGTPRVYYCGMVNTSELAHRLAVPLLIGAGSFKMTSVVAALRSAGAAAWLVSMPVLGRSCARKAVWAQTSRSSNVPAYFLPTASNPFLRKVLAAAAFATFCAVRVKKEDRVLLYNHASEYLLGMVALRLRGIVPVLDVEDVPCPGEHGLKGITNRLLFRLCFRLTQGRKVVVSAEVAAQLSIRDYCAIYGAVSSEQRREDGVASQVRWKELCGGAPLVIHFGGTLRDDTGLATFCDAVRVLTISVTPRDGEIVFLVTGNGGDAELRALQRECSNAHVKVDWLSGLSPDAYRREFARCHAGLSLKVVGSSVAQTTFPSKVVEIASGGRLLITTAVSDIPFLFDDSNAVALATSCGAELAERILELRRNPQRFRILAQRGQLRAGELFDAVQVGGKLADFLSVPRRCLAK